MALHVQTLLEVFICSTTMGSMRVVNVALDVLWEIQLLQTKKKKYYSTNCPASIKGRTRT